jgi:hypothetical protein
MASSMLSGRTSAVALPRTRLPWKLGSMPLCVVVLEGLRAGPGAASCCWVWIATPSSEEPPLEVVALLPPLWEPGACADATCVAIARIIRAIVTPIAFLDAFLSDGIISFMLNRRLHPAVRFGFYACSKQMLFVP